MNLCVINLYDCHRIKVTISHSKICEIFDFSFVLFVDHVELNTIFFQNNERREWIIFINHIPAITVTNINKIRLVVYVCDQNNSLTRLPAATTANGVYANGQSIAVRLPRINTVPSF